MADLYGLFSWKTLLAKAGVGGVIGALIVAIAPYVQHGALTGDWTPTPDLQTALNALIAAGMAALWTAGKNWSKNHPASPFASLFGVLIVAVCLQGCVGLSPAMMGKTNLTTEFHDVVHADNSQDTFYRQTVKAPAGVDLKNIASMTYNWDGQGGGNVAVASEPTANTQGQMDGLVKAQEIEAQRFNQFMQMFTTALQLAGGLAGQNLTNNATMDQLDAANDTAIRQGVLQALQNPEVLKAITQATRPKVVKPVAPVVTEEKPALPK